MKPQPSSVWYNDWRQVDVESLDTFTPTMPVSVIIPYYQTHAAALGMTLAMLECQTYPRDMFEVIIVDDGSDPPLERPLNTALDVKVVRQERRGFGLARARNNGARAAAHDILLFLDSDILTEPTWIAAHARWHHAVSDALTMGPYPYVAMDGIDVNAIRHWRGSLKELFSNRSVDDIWTSDYLRKTNNLISRADDLFRVLPGGNLGVSKWFYELVGNHDESFTRWGLEDVEFGYRAYNQGGLFVCEPDRLSVWHQGWRDEGMDAKMRSERLQYGKIANLIAHPVFRGVGARQIFKAPQYVVTIDGKRGSTDQLIKAVMNIMEDRIYDLVVRIETSDDGDGERLARLREWFCPDPRVRVAPTGSALDEFPASPFHITLPAAVFGRNVVHRLRARLGDAVCATATLPDGTQASITRAWALNRARRTGRLPTDFGEARSMSIRDLKLKSAASVNATAAPEAVNYPTTWDRLIGRLRDVRNFRECCSFLKWMTGAAWFRLVIMRRVVEWKIRARFKTAFSKRRNQSR